MVTTQSTKKSRIKKIMKYAGIGIVSLILIIFVWNTIWIMSGSNKWELEIDKNGVKVYSLKSPGASMKKFRGVTTYNYSLNNVVAPFLDESIQDNCAKWLPGCISYKLIKPWDESLLMNVQLWQFNLFPPFAPREMLLEGHLSQNRQTKEVIVENIAVPNRIPQNDGFVRLTHVHNIWRYTPLINGKLQCEFVQDFELGGFFPNVFMNLGAAGQVYKILHEDVPKMLNSEKYRNSRFNFIKEMDLKVK